MIEQLRKQEHITTALVLVAVETTLESQSLSESVSLRMTLTPLTHWITIRQLNGSAENGNQ